jgi:hypothetical protein
MNRKSKLQTNKPKGFFKFRDPHPNLKGYEFSSYANNPPYFTENWVKTSSLPCKKKVNLQTGSERGFYKYRDSHPKIEGRLFLGYQPKKNKKGTYGEIWKPKDKFGKVQIVSQTGLPIGTFSRGDPHPSMDGHFFFNYDKRKHLPRGKGRETWKPYPPKRPFPKKYPKWTKETVLEHYSQLCKENGDVAFSLSNHKYLNKPLREFFGSKENLDKELGYKPLVVNWTKESFAKAYLDKCKENGDKPWKIPRGHAWKGMVQKHFGSIHDLEKHVGYEPTQLRLSREEWIEEYSKVCKANGDQALGNLMLKSLGRGEILSAFCRFNISKTKVDKDLGYKNLHTYRTPEETFEEYKNLCLKHGDKSLTVTEMEILGKSDLKAAITRHFGKKTKLDIELGYCPCNLYKLSDGSIVSSVLEVIFGNFCLHNNVPFKTNEIIDEKASRKFEYDFLVQDTHGQDCYVEIWGYDRKSDNPLSIQQAYREKRLIKTEFYKERGLKLIDIDPDIFYAVNSKRIQNSLKEMFINHSIKINNFKKIESEDLIKSKNNKVWDKNKVKEKYHSICLKNGDKSVSTIKLNEMGEKGLVTAIFLHFGKKGKTKLDAELGYENILTYWTKESSAKEFLKLCYLNGNKPVSKRKLEKMGKGALSGAIDKHWRYRGDLYAYLGYTRDCLRLRSRKKYNRKN